MTPDQAKIWFDTWAVAILTLWGVAVKYWPKLKSFADEAIGWVNFAAYVVGSFVAGQVAHAAGTESVAQTASLPIIQHGALISGISYVLYKTLVKPMLFGFFGWQKVADREKAGETFD